MSAIADHIVEISDDFGKVDVRKMFGSLGVFLDGRMFAIITRDDEVFVRAGEGHMRTFIDAGFLPFEYSAKGRKKQLRYFRLDVEACASDSELKRWLSYGIESLSEPRKKRSRKTDLGLPISDDPVLGMLIQPRK